MYEKRVGTKEGGVKSRTYYKNSALKGALKVFGRMREERMTFDIRLTLNAHISQSINGFDVIQIGGDSLFQR